MVEGMAVSCSSPSSCPMAHAAAGLGVHPEIVSEMLGPCQIAITLDLYSHVTATMQQEAVRAFEGLVGSQVGSQEGASEH